MLGKNRDDEFEERREEPGNIFPKRHRQITAFVLQFRMFPLDSSGGAGKDQQQQNGADEESEKLRGGADLARQ